MKINSFERKKAFSFQPIDRFSKFLCLSISICSQLSDYTQIFAMDLARNIWAWTDANFSKIIIIHSLKVKLSETMEWWNTQREFDFQRTLEIGMEYYKRILVQTWAATVWKFASVPLSVTIVQSGIALRASLAVSIGKDISLAKNIVMAPP